MMCVYNVQHVHVEDIIIYMYAMGMLMNVLAHVAICTCTCMDG